MASIQNDNPNDIKKECEKERGWISDYPMYKYEGFWYNEPLLKGIREAKESFEGKSTDILLASHMKTGTTWLKALAFAITTRSTFPDMSASPLLRRVPHDFFPLIEADLGKDSSSRATQDILIATHLPYTSLPISLVDSGCKIVYIWRDPKDVFVSLWYFMNKIQKSRKDDDLAIIPLEEAFDLFCRGITTYGPYWDHVLTYWKAKLEFPEKILFLKYEEMKENTRFYVKQLADFMGYPFTAEEQGNNGVMEKIISMCSFENLSELPVNKNEIHWQVASVPIHNNVYFRKGNVGDWENELTPQMGARLDAITNHKFRDSGLLDQHIML